jgi:hypothetical protein
MSRADVNDAASNGAQGFAGRLPVGLPAVVGAAVGGSERREARPDLTHERLAQHAQAPGDDEPDPVALLHIRIPALAFEYLRHRSGVVARLQIDEMADSPGLPRIAAEIPKVLEHLRIGGGRVLHELDLLFHADPLSDEFQEVFLPARADL